MEAAQLLQALRDAHRQHLIEQLQREDHWRHLLAQTQSTLNTQPLGALVDAHSVETVVDLWLQDVLSAQGLQPVIETVSLQVWHAASKDPATVGELLHEEQFDAILQQILTLKKLREKAIHAALNHPLVSELVSEMLYTGIKNFLLEENALAKLPGVSSMMKVGRKSMGKAMGGMEGAIRDYLKKNIRATLRTGEIWLNRELTDERIAQLAHDGYQRTAPLKPADALNTVPDQAIKDIVDQACLITDQSARLEYTRRLVAVGIHAAVDKLMESPLDDLLKAMALPTERLHDMLAPALAKGATVLVEQDVVDPLVTWVLDDFYDSDACKAILDR